MRRIGFDKLISRLTGISTPIFGISWNPTEPERESIRRLITFLEDRRVLFNPYHLEDASEASESVLYMRKKISDTLGEISEGSKAQGALRAMRAACWKFLDEVGYASSRVRPERSRWRRADRELFVALGELRSSFGINLALLAVEYGIDIEEQLASILPVEDEGS